MRRRQHRRRTASFLLWSTLAVVVLLGYLNAHPIELSKPDDEVDGRPVEGAEVSDVLVVLWPDEIVRSADTERFNEVDWSWLWVDLIERELGPVRLGGPEDLTRSLLSEVRVVVLTHSVMAHPAVDEAVHWLEQFVNRGGTLVLERPGGPLREAFSADGRGGQRTPRVITHAARMSDAMAAALRDLPLFTRYVGSTGPLPGAETLLGMDGAPALYYVARAAGTAVTVDFNVGLALVSLLQGRPGGRDLDIVERDEGRGPMITDLLAHAHLDEADVPYADLLAHLLVNVALAIESPVPALWPYPDGADGVVLMTHNVRQDGDRAVWMADYEQAHEARSTFFFSYAATPSPAGADAYPGDDQLAALWQLGDSERAGNRLTIGLGSVRPFYRRVTAAEQRHHLMAALGEPPRGVRVADGVWSDTWSGTLGAAAGAGFTFDSSYGAWTGQDEPLAAYRWGTGRPFRVYDNNGLPLGLYEVPVVAPELSTTPQLEHLLELLAQSRRTFHQAVTIEVPADLFRQPDALTRFDSWRQTIDEAGQRNHRVLDIGSYLDFLEARRTAELSSQVRRDLDDGEGGIQLRIRVNVDDARLWLRLPRDWGERRLRRVLRAGATDVGEEQSEGDESLDMREVDWFGTPYAITPLRQGRQIVRAEYR